MLYDEWKASRGVSPAEIGRKAAALEGVLVPLPAEWYPAALQLTLTLTLNLTLTLTLTLTRYPAALQRCGLG